MWLPSIFSNLHLLPASLRSFGYPLYGTTNSQLQTIMRLSPISLGGLVSSTVATNLYVSSYGGNITSVQLTHLPDGGYSLTEISANNGSLPSPSWLTLQDNVLYCLDEGLPVPNGSIASYKTSKSGEITLIERHPTISVRSELLLFPLHLMAEVRNYSSRTKREPNDLFPKTK